MLTREQWDAIRVGDVILWNGRPRIVRAKSERSIGFASLHRSWTNRAVAGYDRTAACVMAAMPDSDDVCRELGERAVALEACQREQDALAANGFSAIDCLRDEISHMETLSAVWKEYRDRHRRELAFAKRTLRRLENEMSRRAKCTWRTKP